MVCQKGDVVVTTDLYVIHNGFTIHKGYSGIVLKSCKGTILVKFSNLKAPYWVPKRILTLKRNCEMKNYISLNGKKIPLSDETAKEMAESFRKEELETFEDCWNKVISDEFYYVSPMGVIIKNTNTISKGKRPLLPRKELARKVQLYIKLLVVAEAVNDGWKKMNDGSSYCYISLKKDGRLNIGHGNTLTGDIMFKDGETAQKAIDICPELWKEYLKIQ